MRKSLQDKLSSRKTLYLIIALGTLLRVLFVLIGGKLYYGSSNYFIQGDTSSWFQAFINLWEHGTFTVDLYNEAGKFYRPPGYSFLFGIFYVLTFKNYVLAWKLLVFVQVLMDITSIYLISRIADLATKNSSTEKRKIFSNVTALLYALYPFVIVWAPVLYAETSSIFFMFLSIYYAMKHVSIKNAFLSGLFIGIAALIRLQCAFCMPFIAISFFLSDETILKLKIRTVLIFGCAVLITYGLWPARNIFLQHRVLFSQDLNIGNYWSRDFLSFLDFIYSVRTDHTPVYRQIIQGEKVDWPKEAFIDSSDSMLLDSVVRLCRTCGTGFSYWMVFENRRQVTVPPAESCDTSIDKIFTSLYLKQKYKNPFNYWGIVPLGNLKKCLFKFNLYGNKSTFIKWLSSVLFLFRTIFVFLGFLGIYLGIKNQFFQTRFWFLVISYVIMWYMFLSFFYRNIEMRYLLQCDVLLLIPSAYIVIHLLLKHGD